VVWQNVIGMVCVLFAVLRAVLCSGVAACHRHGVCTVRCVEGLFSTSSFESNITQMAQYGTEYLRQ